MRTICNKTALITGAAGGIGRAIALQLAREGAHLFLLDVNEFELARVVSEGRKLGVDVIGRYCDVSDFAQLASAARVARARCQSIDILVNNAGIAYYGETEKMSAADAQRLLDVNLHAPIQLTRELLPSMLARPESHIVNVASFLGLIGTRRLSLYSASKFGLVGFSESLRAEYGRHGLGVTALCPGFVDTRLFESAPLGADRSEPKLPPNWLLVTPEKVAERAVKAIYRNRAIEIPQLYARAAHLAKRFLPSLLDWANHLSRSKKNQDQTGRESSPTLRKAG